MGQEIKDILSIYKNILNNKSIVNETALISPLDKISVNSGFGPRGSGNHNGVDLAANAAEVKSPADGVVEKVAADEYPCGGTIVINHAGGFKTGFCHMQKINVSAGQQVKQGDIIGISGGGASDPGHGRSDGRHLHFTLRKDGQLVNPIDYIDKSGVVMTGEPPKSSSDTEKKDEPKSDNKVDFKSVFNLGTPTTNKIGSTTTSGNEFTTDFLTNTNSKNTIVYDLAKEFGKAMGLKEEKIYGSFGKNFSERGGHVVIPKEGNTKIKSPVSGKVNNSKYLSDCANKVAIEHEINGKKYFLLFCGISKPSVTDGQSVSKGTTLGTTDNDVNVSLYDSKWDREYISSFMDKEISPVKKEKERERFDEPVKKKGFEPEGDLAKLMLAPFKLFKNKRNEKGEIVQKRWARVGEKEQPEPWIKKLSPTYNPEKQDKKLKENINRIKGLL
jgi:murein DD-endopeptidase MepM/ murein hydrolase activator NlpD